MKWNDPTRVRFVWFLTPHAGGGQNHKNRDCAKLRHAVVSPFWGLILVGTYEWIAPILRCRIRVCHFGGGGRVSTPILLPYLVCLISSLAALLTHSTCYSELGELSRMLL